MPRVGKFLLVNPVEVLGAEVEGGAPAYSVGMAVVPVYLAGPWVPMVGDLLVCRFVDFRWVADRQGRGTMGPGACTGLLLPGSVNYVYFSCPNGGFTSGRPSLAMSRGAPSCGLGPFPVFGAGAGFPFHHVTLSASAWYTPFSPDIHGNSGMGAFQAVTGAWICLYFSGCSGFLMTIFTDGLGNPFVYDYDLTWSFPLLAVAHTVGGLTFGANTNSPFSIGQATTTQSGAGPSLTGQFGPILSGASGSAFPSTSVGLPVFSV